MLYSGANKSIFDDKITSPKIPANYLAPIRIRHVTQYLLCYIVKNPRVYGNKKGGHKPPESFLPNHQKSNLHNLRASIAPM